MTWKRLLVSMALGTSIALCAVSGAIDDKKSELPKAKTSVAHQSCGSCHKTHGVPNRNQKLLRQAGEAACQQCHLGDPAIPSVDGAPHIKDVKESMGGGSTHIEGLQPIAKFQFSRKITERGKKSVLQSGCLGCHDSHGREKGRLRSMGFDFRGEPTSVRPQSTAQICFGCHAGPGAIRLKTGEPDFGKLFNSGGASLHGLGVAAKDRVDLPSLRASTYGGKLDCISCHDNPDASGPKGPHSSRFPALLKAAFGREGDMGIRGNNVNDLCFSCHDQYSIKGNQSFPLHREHLEGFTASSRRSSAKQGAFRDAGKNASGSPTSQSIRSGILGMVQAGLGEPAACATCHDPHGSRENPSLINFDRKVVSPSSVGGIEFVKSGLRQGTCTLMCHGHDHVHSGY